MAREFNTSKPFKLAHVDTRYGDDVYAALMAKDEHIRDEMIAGIKSRLTTLAHETLQGKAADAPLDRTVAHAQFDFPDLPLVGVVTFRMAEKQSRLRRQNVEMVFTVVNESEFEEKFAPELREVRKVIIGDDE